MAFTREEYFVVMQTQGRIDRLSGQNPMHPLDHTYATAYFGTSDYKNDPETIRRAMLDLKRKNGSVDDNFKLNIFKLLFFSSL